MRGKDYEAQDYQSAKAMWGTRRRKLGNNTYLVGNPDEPHNPWFGIQLHGTTVLRWWEDGTISLKANGWHTNTTKDRMNHGLFLTNWSVASHRGEWRVYFRAMGFETSRPFKDGILLHPDGQVEGHGYDPKTEAALRKKLEEDYAKNISTYRRQKIRKYVHGYVQKLRSGGMGQPGPLDCWFCRMEMDTWLDTGHLYKHMKDENYVPSLMECVMKDGRITEHGKKLVKDYMRLGSQGPDRYYSPVSTLVGAEEQFRQIEHAMRVFFYSRMAVDFN